MPTMNVRADSATCFRQTLFIRHCRSAFRPWTDSSVQIDSFDR